MAEMEDQDNSEEVSSIPSAGPSSPLLPVAPREIPAGLHQQVECEPDMLFVPEEEVWFEPNIYFKILQLWPSFSFSDLSEHVPKI